MCQTNLLYLVYTTFVDVLFWTSVTETENGTLNLSIKINGMLLAMDYHFYEVSCAGKANSWFKTKQGTRNIFFMFPQCHFIYIFNYYKFIRTSFITM